MYSFSDVSDQVESSVSFIRAPRFAIACNIRLLFRRNKQRGRASRKQNPSLISRLYKTPRLSWAVRMAKEVFLGLTLLVLDVCWRPFPTHRNNSFHTHPPPLCSQIHPQAPTVISQQQAFPRRKLFIFWRPPPPIFWASTTVCVGKAAFSWAQSRDTVNPVSPSSLLHGSFSLSAFSLPPLYFQTSPGFSLFQTPN